MQDRRHAKSVENYQLGVKWLLIAALAVTGLVGAGARLSAADGRLEYEGSQVGETAAFAFASPVGTIGYVPGRGLRLGDTRLTLGGYGSVSLTRDEGDPAQLKLEDLSFFILADPLPRLHLFTELEFEDLLTIDDQGRGGTGDAVFTAERLYGDLALSDRLNVRLGKFLTPVGRWNVIHAEPLVWTTSRPLVTVLPFDNHTTGAMLFGSVFPAAGSVGYSVFGQFLDQLDPVDQPQPAERSAGARVEYGPVPAASIGASYFGFRDAGEWQHVAGLDTSWRRGPVELMGEFAYGQAPSDPGSQWGLYLQTVIELRPRLHFVTRYEHFDQRAPAPEVNLFVLGLAYKPVPYVVLKAEYLIADHRAEESSPGPKASIAILF